MSADIKKLDDRQHILARPSMYIGAIDKTEIQDYIFENDSLKYGAQTIVPGLLKIINEIIDNSIDAAIRSNFKCGCNISVKMDDNYVIVKDDGAGIPFKKADGEYMALLAWNFAKAGANFDDDENRVTIGMNGVGSYCTNVWSTKFIGTTHNSGKAFKFTSKNNASEHKYEINDSNNVGTEVKFYPDLKRFKIDKIDEQHQNAIYQRLINLSVCYPELNFKFNNKSIKISTFKKLAQLFNAKAEIYENKNISIAIVPNGSDDFKQYSYVNGLKISDGGTHIDSIMQNVVSGVREKLQKRYKNIKPGDIKNKLTCVVFMRGFPNAKFNSQSKEKITNSAKEFNDFAQIDYSFVNKIIKNAAIIDPIVEVYKIKEEYESRKALKAVESKKKLKSEKYFKCTKTPKYLCICEGFSAYGGISVVLGNTDIEYYVLKGKPLNAFEISNQKLSSNRELSELYQLLSQNSGYAGILGATDSDLDGTHIVSLLAGFFERFLPEQKHKFGRLATPVKAATKAGKITRWTYSLAEDFEPKAGESIKYFKGLGTWDKEQLEAVIAKDGLENMIEYFDFDDPQILKDFLSSDESDKRKEYIRNNNFSIAKI